MAKDDKNACKYFTYITKSEYNCFNVSWTFMDYSKLEIDKEYINDLYRSSVCYLDLIFEKGSSFGELCVRKKTSGIVTSDITTTLYNEDRKELLTSNIIGASINENVKTRVIFFCDYNDPNYLPNDTLTFDIEFRIKQVKTLGTFDEMAMNDFKLEKKLLKDLSKVIHEKLPTQVILKTKDDQIEANKAILCARSSVFKNMFENPMSEQENDTVLIEDIRGATVRILVDFLYTDDADLKKLESSSLNELYYAADKYDVQDLKKMCAAHILHGLTIENVCGALELAQKHSDNHLKKGCMLFIRRNIVPFMESEGWKTLKTSDSHLGHEIFEFYVKGVVTNPE